MYHLWMTLLHHIPEGPVIFYVGFFLAKVTRPIPLTLLLGVVYGIALGLFRVALPTGYHMPAIVLFAVGLYRWAGRVPWSRSVFAALSTFVLIGLSGIAVETPWIMWRRLSYEEVLGSVPLSVVGAWLEDVFLIGVALYAYISRRRAARKAVAGQVNSGAAS